MLHIGAALFLAHHSEHLGLGDLAVDLLALPRAAANAGRSPDVFTITLPARDPEWRPWFGVKTGHDSAFLLLRFFYGSVAGGAATFAEVGDGYWYVVEVFQTGNPGVVKPIP